VEFSNTQLTPNGDFPVIIDNVETTARVYDGTTVLLNLGKYFVESRSEFGPPILSDIPYVNRLFRNVGYGRETQTVMLLITARIVPGFDLPDPTPPVSQQAPMPCTDSVPSGPELKPPPLPESYTLPPSEANTLPTTEERNAPRAKTTPLSADDQAGATGQAMQIVATWERSVVMLPNTELNGKLIPCLAGRLWIFDRDGKLPLLRKGDVRVSLFAHDDIGQGRAPKLIEEWSLSSSVLEKMCSRDMIGYGYNLPLPWATYRANLKNLTLVVTFTSPNGEVLLSRAKVRLNDSTKHEPAHESQLAPPGAQDTNHFLDDFNLGLPDMDP
jgi:hypothetical protein